MALVIKFIILLVFLVFMFLAVNFFLKKININNTDKKGITILFNLSASLVIILIVMYLYNLNLLSVGEFIGIVLASFLLGYLIFSGAKTWLRNFIFLIKQRLEYGDFVEYNQKQYRFLTIHKRKLLLEDLDGQVVEIPITDELIINKLEKGICIEVNNNTEIEIIKKVVEKNPFIPPENIAVYLEDELNGNNPKLKVFIKDCDNFQKIKQFKQFLQNKIK